MSYLPRRPLKRPPAYNIIKRHPFALFGLPLILSIVAGSYALSHLTQTRYEVHSNKTRKVEKEELLQMNKDRQVPNLQEEYWKLQLDKEQLDNWENKRVERTKDQFDGVL
ncbi:cytochrome c oxidase assembly protein COX16-domain-containing protein [Gigaspora rosea]|uniref:Cytochrome c oxidase assembly protein COX16, mitochondrial n=1 Tax=Gigaspora rosea TaxID=44941 RepID=A0A397VNI1_9GLOM|nr:cytochrome c oxidase assembly protein COX16-domain-containing protein [Gigaspora rosea]